MSVYNLFFIPGTSGKSHALLFNLILKGKAFLTSCKVFTNARFCFKCDYFNVPNGLYLELKVTKESILFLFFFFKIEGLI